MYRYWMRSIPELCPEVSYTKKSLALHCLQTSYGNYVCLYHTYYDKTGKISDHTPGINGYQVTGVPWQRLANGKSSHGRIKKRTGALHCGCAEQDVLLDFWWWKTGVLSSPSTAT